MVFSYQSTQVHSTFASDGFKGSRGNKGSKGITPRGITPRGITPRGITPKGITRRNHVSIQGNKGTKSVSITDTNGKERQIQIPLTKKEIQCIRRNEFVPGLFKDCITRIKSRKTRRTRK